MIVAPCASHSFGIFVIGHHVGVVLKFKMANGANPVLLDDLAIYEFSHLRR